MAKKRKYLHIVAVLDRSGSMGTIAKDMNGGLDAFLKKQAEEFDGTILVDVTTFDTVHEHPYEDTPIEKVDASNLIQPRGGTALLDALGFAVTRVEDKFKKGGKKGKKKPDRCLFIVITDGYENSSKEWKKADVAKKIAKHDGKDGWAFIFLGANIDSFAEGTSLGLRGANTLNWEPSAAGVASAFVSTASYTADWYENPNATLKDHDEKVKKSETTGS